MTIIYRRWKIMKNKKERNETEKKTSRFVIRITQTTQAKNKVRGQAAAMKITSSAMTFLHSLSVHVYFFSFFFCYCFHHTKTKTISNRWATEWSKANDDNETQVKKAMRKRNNLHEKWLLIEETSDGEQAVIRFAQCTGATKKKFAKNFSHWQRQRREKRRKKTSKNKKKDEKWLNENDGDDEVVWNDDG